MRLLAVYLLIQAANCIVPLGMFFSAYTAQNHKMSVSEGLIVFGPIVWNLGLGLLVFYFSASLARKLVPPQAQEEKEVTFSFTELQVIAFALVGILIIADSFPEVARAFSQFMQLSGRRSNDPFLTASRSEASWLFCAAVFIKLAFGLALLLNPKMFRNAWHWLRTANH